MIKEILTISHLIITNDRKETEEKYNMYNY